MLFKDGYLCGEEDVEKLPVEVLEDILIHIHEDNYLNQSTKEDLLKLYLEERKSKLDKAFHYTEENLQRLRDMNTLIERQSKEALETAWQIYQDELAEKAAHPETYRDVAIKPILTVPRDMYYRMHEGNPDCVFTEKEEEVWKVLCSPENSCYTTFSMLLMSAPFITHQPQPDLQAVIREVVYGCQGDEEPTPWGMAGLDWEKIKGICFNWPFHTLFEHCAFAMTDILRIQKYDLKIELGNDPA